MFAEGLLCECSYLYVAGLETFGPNLSSVPRGNRISDQRKGIVFPRNSQSVNYRVIAYKVFKYPAFCSFPGRILNNDYMMTPLSVTVTGFM